MKNDNITLNGNVLCKKAMITHGKSATLKTKGPTRSVAVAWSVESLPSNPAARV